LLSFSIKQLLEAVEARWFYLHLIRVSNRVGTRQCGLSSR